VVITSVAALDLEDVSIRDAHQAGFRTLHALRDELARHPDGQLYRIGLRYAGADPRIALRERDDVTGSERDELVARVTRLGVKSADGPWALATLQLIASHPGTLAARLARRQNLDTPRFKARVRQLKELGLTESLAIGYRLSPRGAALLRALTGTRAT
jgi:hypothetical protein